MNKLILAAVSLFLSTAAVSVTADDHGASPDRKPSSGSGPQGGTGSKPMSEGLQVGAPGNIVTSAESSVMRSHDKDNDGVISADEASKDKSLNEVFATLDTNADGHLDAIEFDRYQIKDSAVTGAAPTRPPDPTTKSK